MSYGGFISLQPNNIMKVQDVMTCGVQTCQLDTNMAEAAMQMWTGDFGILPVLGFTGHVVGVITDRDICMAAATKHCDIADVPVKMGISGNVYQCSPDTDIHEALKIMREKKVRRLPVITADRGQLVGLLSLNDLALKARQVRSTELTAQDVEDTLSDICDHQPLRMIKSPALGTAPLVPA
jgi:CBS domain-containing protein